MISIAMVLMLMAGINAVFSATQKTAGTGMALSSIMRDVRGMERVFTRDMRRAVPLSEAPFLVINSRQVYAFRDRQEQASNIDPASGQLNTAAYADNGTGVHAIISPVVYNHRNHRVDTIGFFARDVQTPFSRQTGNQIPTATPPSKPLFAWPPEVSKEAYIWYGHLNVPSNTLLNPDPRLAASVSNGDYFQPGEPSVGNKQNTSNYFYNDWCFGRMAMLMRPPTTAGSNFIGFIPYDASTNPSVPCLGAGQPAATLGSPNPPVIPGVAGNPAWWVEHSRFDVVDATIRGLRQHILDYNIPAGVVAGATDYRFNCKPWTARWDPVLNVPRDMSLEAALTVPLLMRGVSHFAVEYAGDFVTQRSDGLVTGPRPDGVIDFVLLDPTDVPNSPKPTRWYGMPRYVNPVNPVSVPSIPTDPAIIRNSCSVVPLRDVSLDAADGTQMPGNPEPCEDFSTGGVSITDYVTDLQPGAAYRAFFTPRRLANPTLVGRPSLIRFVVTFSDPNGRLPEGYTAEYVFSLTY